MAPMTNPSVTPQLSQSQIWILIKSYKAPHDLPPWPLCLIPFHSPPLTRQLQSPWSWLLRKHTKLIFGSLCLLITEGFPDPL